MRGAEIRGFVAFAAVIIAIVVAWTTIENRDTTADVAVSTTTSTTTTTARPVTSTTTVEQARDAICERSETLMLEIFLQGGGDESTTTSLTLAYWTDLLDLVASEIRVEVVAVVDYYGDYLDVGGPFDFDTERIIVDGDKERWQQLITRPATGLAEARALVGFLCGIELPEQRLMDDDDFDDLEDRLLRNARRSSS